MNVIKQIQIDNSDGGTIEKLNTLLEAFHEEEHENARGYGRSYSARRRYRRMLNKLSGGLGGECHAVTSNGWNSNGEKTLVIGNQEPDKHETKGKKWKMQKNTTVGLTTLLGA